MNYYIFQISSKPKVKHLKWGRITTVRYEDREYEYRLFKSKYYLPDVYQKVNKIMIELDEEPGKSRPYPDFISLDIAYSAINFMAKDFLIDNDIEFSTVPTDVVNDNYKYDLIFFQTKDVIDFNKTSGTFNDKGFFHQSFDSELVLKPEARDFKGIFRVYRLHNLLICDEETKKKLEKSKLSGFYFEKIKVETI